VHQTDLMFVASRRPLRGDVAALRARITEEPFASGLKAAWRAVELEDVLARFVAGPEWARSLRSPGQSLNTDDRNQVEFAFARSLSRSERFDVVRLRRDAAALRADRPALDGSVDWARVARQRAAIYFVAGANPIQEPAASAEERIRIQALTQYLAGELGAAVRTFEKQPVPPEGPIETTIFAEGLADLGDSRAVGFIKELRNVDLVEAEAATARLAFRVGQFELAKDALVSAFTRYRTEPWASQVSMSHALSLADDLTLARRELVPAIFDALGQPFAVAALEESRRLVRLSVESHSGTLLRCHDALAPYERHIAWRLDVLQYRAQCYQRTADPRLPQALSDLEDFKRLEPATPNKPR
jgi:spermidine synthase